MQLKRIAQLQLNILGLIAAVIAAEMPPPFTRNLYLTQPYMTGNDVTIAQTLLSRDEAVSEKFVVTGEFDESSDEATKLFQQAHQLQVDGIIGQDTAEALLDLHTADGYKDNGFTAASMGYLYKIHIPVHKNRSIETYATLFDAENNILHRFKTRQHGHRDDGSDAEWPDFGDGDNGLTELASNGNSVTGLVELDLNSPEPDPQLYGPWPVNRVVRGLDGNALLMLPNIRDGILIHTGNWTIETQTYSPLNDMPNSSGCVHAHPLDIQRIYQILTDDLGIEIHENPFSGKDYPYKPQGVGVVELITE